MQAAPLSRVIKFAAASYGKDAECDRAFLVAQINQVREAKWKNPNFRDIIFTSEGCEKALCIEEACSQCRSPYVAIMLPSQVTSITSLKVNGYNIKVRTGAAGGGCVCGDPTAEIEGKNPLYRSHEGGKMIFYAHLKKDEGLRLGVSYGDGYSDRREDLILRTDGVGTSKVVCHLTELTFPERCGAITVRSESGVELGHYPAPILSPSHVRVRINGVAAGALVHWVGLREPVDVFHDSDLVEWGGRLDWMNDFMWLKGHLNENKTRGETFAYQAAAAFSALSSDSEAKATHPVHVATLRPQRKAYYSLIRSLR